MISSPSQTYDKYQSRCSIDDETATPLELDSL